MKQWDVIIIGAGAAGLMCAIEAGKRGRRVLVVDHAKKPAEKIRISGGGRCNFTNLHASPANFLSQNPRFCISALKQYTQHDFIALVEKHGIGYTEKTLGQLFCDEKSHGIITMLLTECEQAGVTIQLETSASDIAKTDAGFSLTLNDEPAACESLVVACGGLSIPKMGATGFGYELAKQFGLSITPTRAALVPFTLEGEALAPIKALAGTAFDSHVMVGKRSFHEASLFTHRGLSGPAMLQISSYWREGEPLTINATPVVDMFDYLKNQKAEHPKKDVQAALADYLPKRLAASICEEYNIRGRLADLPNKALQQLANRSNAWRITPDGTEGYRTAEVTLGGVDTSELSSKTMMAKSVENLYFIGEVVDVTGHLGGFNFQWAWSSGFVAGQYA